MELTNGTPSGTVVKDKLDQRPKETRLTFMKLDSPTWQSGYPDIIQGKNPEKI